MKASSLLNWFINNLPFELHLPGYNYCGPGTRLQKRLARGDKGINLLDEHCKDHDIAYGQSSSLLDRHKADIKLLQMARYRKSAPNASVGEKIAANLVHKAMLAKVSTGSGLSTKIKKSRRSKKTGRGLLGKFKTLIMRTKKHIDKLKPKHKQAAIELAIAAARDLVADNTVKSPRVIPVPKTGGTLNLIPILAGLSATGSLAGGADAVTKVIKDFQIAKKQLANLKKRKHNIGGSLCIGKGLHLKQHGTGLGIYVSNKKN